MALPRIEEGTGGGGVREPAARENLRDGVRHAEFCL
jgi:hypothetical protein